MIKSKEDSLALIEIHLMNLILIDDSYWEDRDFLRKVLDIVFANTLIMRKKYSKHIKCNFDLIKGDKDIIEKLLMIDIALYENLCEKDKKEEYVKSILIDSKHDVGLKYLNNDLQTKQLVMEAVKNNGENYAFVRLDLRDDNEIIKKSFETKLNFAFVSNKKFEDTLFVCDLMNILKEREVFSNINKLSSYVRVELCHISKVFENKDFKDMAIKMNLDDYTYEKLITMLIEKKEFDKLIGNIPMILEGVENEILKKNIEISIKDNNKNSKKIKF